MGTKIEWTDETWNPVTGCDKVSEGCRFCYAERMAKRLAGRYGYPKDDPFDVRTHWDKLKRPYRWRKPRRVFVCSMSDLFHPVVPGRFLEAVWGAICENRLRHTFQVLTKRPEAMRTFVTEWNTNALGGIIPSGIWLGVSAENQDCADQRIPLLLQTPAAVRFVSVEPMLGAVDLTALTLNSGCTFNSLKTSHIGRAARIEHWPALDWVIIGCESGPGRRPMKLDWARDLVRQCKAAGVPVFVKQLNLSGRVSKNPAEWPEDLRVREYPA